MPATVERLEYDPNRTAFIALIKYEDGELSYILAPQRLAAGRHGVAGDKVDVKPGNAMPLANMPVGTIVHNVEMKPGKGGQIARAAGTYAQLVGRDAGYAILRLNSGETRLVRPSAWRRSARCPIPTTCNISIGKAGRDALEGPQPDRARRRDEPDRPSAWRRRRPHQGRPASGHAVGQADQGQEDAQEQGDRQVHPAQPPRSKKKG